MEPPPPGLRPLVRRRVREALGCCTPSRTPFLRSEFYNLPAFLGGIPNVGELLAADADADPKGKYSVLAESPTWATNQGHPGHDNAAIEEVVNEYIVPKMFSPR